MESPYQEGSLFYSGLKLILRIMVNAPGYTIMASNQSQRGAKIHGRITWLELLTKRLINSRRLDPVKIHCPKQKSDGFVRVPADFLIIKKRLFSA